MLKIHNKNEALDSYENKVYIKEYDRKINLMHNIVGYYKTQQITDNIEVIRCFAYEIIEGAIDNINKFAILNRAYLINKLQQPILDFEDFLDLAKFLLSASNMYMAPKEIFLIKKTSDKLVHIIPSISFIKNNKKTSLKDHVRNSVERTARIITWLDNHRHYKSGFDVLATFEPINLLEIYQTYEC